MHAPTPAHPAAYTAADRFWAKVQRTETCWNWLGAQSNGYGRFFTAGDRDTPPALALAHRWSYEQAFGAIPDGLHIDHLCRNRACVNPAHLEAVTCRVNVLRGVGISAVNARKTHCKRGHELTPENIYIQPSQPSRRRCRACKAMLNAKHNPRRRRGARS